MKYKMIVYGALCELRIFEINGIMAESHHFGEKQDTAPEDAEPYGCGNMQFLSKPADPCVLLKYGISTEEYNIIADELKEKLSFGCCGWCV